MGKEIAAARRFPFERRTEPARIDRQKQQIFLPGEVFRQGLGHLLSGGELTEAVATIIARA